MSYGGIPLWQNGRWLSQQKNTAFRTVPGTYIGIIITKKFRYQMQVRLFCGGFSLSLTPYIELLYRWVPPFWVAEFFERYYLSSLLRRYHLQLIHSTPLDVGLPVQGRWGMLLRNFWFYWRFGNTPGVILKESPPTQKHKQKQRTWMESGEILVKVILQFNRKWLL